MLRVLKSGFYTTLQDSGRFGFRNMGVPVSGVLDEVSVKKANILLENNPEDAVLEITMTGPTLLFEAPTFICLSGALLSATLNNKPVENYKVIKVESGDILSYGKLESGFRGYLAVKNGFQGQKVLNSYSQYFPVTQKKHIKEGEEIPYMPVQEYQPAISELKLENHLAAQFLEVYKGPEFSLLSKRQLERLFSMEFVISEKNNRMAYQLSETIEPHAHTMVTSGTLPGTVQLTPAGKLIILMKDGQTTGGYPRILQLSEHSISVLAQKKSGDTIVFKLV
ncbi:biotin-dependent carboxyltransferase family protein [Flagellimonas sp.]|uniref:5-oxoprolinase subunit C family protein n=1 Tax=Flagellimonas sp. TaxID=2058762 RepID=UPI003F4A0EE2